jgi:hypothetical protein
MKSSASDGAELAGVSDYMQAKELILGNGCTLGHVDGEFHGKTHADFGAAALDVAVQILPHDAGGCHALHDSCAFEVNHLWQELTPCAVSIFEVDAGLGNSRRRTGGDGGRGILACRGLVCADLTTRGWTRRYAGGLEDHGGEDLIARAGSLQGDKSVCGGVLCSGVGVDGGDDQVFGQSGFDHLDDGSVVHRRLCLGRLRLDLLCHEQGAKYEERSCQNLFTHPNISRCL